MGFFESSESEFDKGVLDENYLANQQRERNALEAKYRREGASQDKIDEIWGTPYKNRGASFYDEFLNNATKQSLPEVDSSTFGNYVGPYWSDGKFQNSVAFGETEVKSVLDYLARFHDTVYAEYADREHREASDIFFNDIAQTLQSNFAHIAGNTVLYGNYTARQMSNVVGEIKTRLKSGDFVGALGSLASVGFGNIKQAHKLTNETYLRKEWEHLKELYHKDPKLAEAMKPKVSSSGRRPQVRPTGHRPVRLDLVPREEEPRVASATPGTESLGAEKNMPRTKPDISDATHHILPNGKALMRKVRVQPKEARAPIPVARPDFKQELDQIKKRLKSMGFSYKIEPQSEKVMPLQPKALLKKKKKTLGGMNIRTLFKK